MSPKVSVGIPFFNAEKYLRLSIETILNQSFQDFELILIDDGSTDNSLAIARSFNDKRIIVVSDGINKGLPYRLNQLVEMARAKYIARMDADDFVSLNRFEKQVLFLDKYQHIDVVATGICTISLDEKVIAYRLPYQEIENVKTKDIINGCIEIAHATVMVRKSWYERNKYDENAKLMEDYRLWIDASYKNDLNVGFIKEPLYFYREESSINFKKLVKAYKNQINLILFEFKLLTDFKFKTVFFIKVLAKIIVSCLLLLTKNLDKLLLIRNRNTIQKKNVIIELQQEIDAIKAITEK